MENPKDGDSFLWKGEQWLTLSGFREVSRQFAEGWCEGRRDGVLPCPGFRIIRVTLPDYTFDKVVHVYSEMKKLSAGMMPAGIGFQWPYILRAVEKGLEHVVYDARGDKDLELATFRSMELALEVVHDIRSRRKGNVPETDG